MRVAFKTFGCRLNQAEADTFAAAFAANGCQLVEDTPESPAEVVVIHSCAVTRTAEQECLRLCRSLARRVPRPFVVLSGCTVEAADHAALAASGVALIVPRGLRDELVSRVLEACSTRPTVPVPARPAVRRVRPFLKVQDGCDFCCSYCIVPRTRGAPVSRPFEDCLADAQGLVAAGARELVLAGCNTARYRDGSRGLADLLRALTALPGLARIRLGSIEPATVERLVADLMAETPTLCRQLHLPLQSGDDAVLRAMGRRYTAASYHAAAEYAVSRVPDLGLGTDIITGFPGETDAQFDNTRRLIAALPFSNLHVFPYSERPGTPAVHLPGVVPPAVRKARAAELIALGETMRQRFARTFLGRPVTCLVERVDAGGAACGWSDAYLPCRITGLTPVSVGDLVTFTPTAVGDKALLTGDELLAVR